MRFWQNNKEYYKEPPTWPFTRLEPHQVRYLIHKQIEDVKNKVSKLGEALL